MSEAILYCAIYGFAGLAGICLALVLLNRSHEADFPGRAERPKRWRDM